MKIKLEMRIISRLSILFILIYNNTTAQNISPNILKAAMTYKYMVNLSWPKENNLQTFKVGVITVDKETVNEFTKTLSKSQLRGKPIKVVQLTSIEEIKDFQVIYTDSNYSKDIKNAFAQIGNKAVLLVSDEAEDKRSVMINFYRDIKNQKFELNKANIINANITIGPSLILLGGTEIDVAALYKDTQQNLDKEKEKVSQQQIDLDKMRSEIDIKKLEIEKQKLEIVEQRAAIVEQKREIADQKNTLTSLNKDVQKKQAYIDQKVAILNSQMKRIATQEDAIKQQEAEMKARAVELTSVTTEIEKQQTKYNTQKQILDKQNNTIKVQQNLLYIFIAFIGLIVVLAFFIVRSYFIQKRFNRALAEKNDEITQQGEELFMQSENLKQANIEVQQQSIKVEELYLEIKDSIRAAEVIQNSILPSTSVIKKHLPESFIFYKPKDIVSGDFYWFDIIDENIILAAVDCTGHGVSGALMSITGHHLLNQSIYQIKELSASNILNNLNEGIIKELQQEEEDSQTQDGMDIALCIIDKEKKKLQFSGANNPLYILRDKEIIQIKANKYPIGMVVKGQVNSFNNNEIELQKGDIIYMFSDGYADQIGGVNGDEKFLYTRFRELLIEYGNESMETQKLVLDTSFQEWRKDQEQLDDILVIGFKV